MQSGNVKDIQSPKMLSKELQELELNGMVKRSVLNAKPVTVEYELTEYGHTLKPVIDVIVSRGMQHRQRVIKELSQNGNFAKIAEA